MIKKHFLKFIKKNYLTIALLVLLLPFYILIYKLYIPHSNSFGCFDDCFNFLGGYFMEKGKTIYDNFFFNHQPLPAFISYLIQQVTNPQSIFELVLRHRQLIVLLSFILSIILVARFKLPGFIFVIIFELSKFYLFGDRFLAEGIIVYPIAFITGLALNRLVKQKTSDYDYILASFFAWFIIFSREPYIPYTLLLILAIFWGRLSKIKYISLGLFSVLTFFTLFLIKFNVSEYIFDVAIYNYQAVLPSDVITHMWGPQILQSFLYPFYIPFYGNLNLLKTVLLAVDFVFLIQAVYLIFKRKYLLTILIFIILGFSNLRVIVPGTTFYEAYRYLVWCSAFLFTTFFLVFYNSKQKVLLSLSLLIIALSMIFVLSQHSYFGYEKVNTQQEFLNNYGTLLQEGEVIKAISKPNQSLFIDGSDDLIYWQANRISDYKYVIYSSQMPAFKKFTDAREEMFRNNPPEFYREFGSCPKTTKPSKNMTLPSFAKNEYIRLYNGDKPSCIYVRKDVISKISKQQWSKANEFLYNMKPDEKN